MNQELKDALEQEGRAQDYLKEMKRKIVTDVSNCAPIPGVKLLENSNVSAAIVQFSTLKKNNLSPSTYIPQSQGGAIGRCIAPCATVRSLLNTLRQAVGAGYVRFSGGEQVTLNENTIEVLSDYLE